MQPGEMQALQKAASGGSISPHRALSARFRLAAIALGVIVALVFAEALLWTFFPKPHPLRGPAQELSLNVYLRPQIFQDARMVLHPDPKVMPGTRSPSNFTLNTFGFRSPRLQRIPKAVGEVRILCLGGSTTECLYLDDQDSWPEQVCKGLQAAVNARRRVDVINAGVSGHNTREHIGTLAQRGVPFEPDVVVILAGTNDLTLQLLTPDYDILRRDARSRYTHRCPEPGDAAYLTRVLACNASQIARRVEMAWRSSRKTDDRGNPVQDLEGRWQEEVRIRNKALPDGGHLPDSLSLTEFEQNLRTLVGMTQAHKAIPVLLTQPTMLRRGLTEAELWLCAYVVYQERRCPPEEFRHWLDRFNDMTRKVAASTGAVLVDLAAALSGQTELFYDAFHFNVAGAEQVATHVSQALLADERTRKRLGLGVRP